MSSLASDRAALVQAGFETEDKRPERDYLVVTCETCGQRWSAFIRENRVSPGPLLKLLDHAKSHR